MATLRQTTTIARHILVIGLLTIVGIFLLVTLINFIQALYPAPPAPPTVAFGKLPAIIFPPSITNTQLQYNIDTLSGNLPTFAKKATIYRIQSPQPDLLALDTTTTLVGKMGYTANPMKVSDTLYQWTNTDTLPKTILMDILTNNFAITSNYSSDPDVIQANNLPDENGAIDAATTYLQDAALLPNDINTSKTKATLLSIANGQLVPASSLSSAQVIQVDLFQNDVHGLSIFYPQPTHSTMTFYIAGGSSVPQIVLANFNHQSVGSDTATYPIITTQEAFDALKKGQGYIASYDGTTSNISIHSIVLGYYMSDKTQSYLIPIFAFEGDNGFFAYVPAVTSALISK